MIKFNNPALTEEPRYQRTKILPQQENLSILDWLEKEGHLVAAGSEQHYLEDSLEEEPLTAFFEPTEELEEYNYDFEAMAVDEE